jgi:hypothetical protein
MELIGYNPEQERSIRLTLDLWGRGFGGVRVEVVHISR